MEDHLTITPMRAHLSNQLPTPTTIATTTTAATAVTTTATNSNHHSNNSIHNSNNSIHNSNNNTSIKHEFPQQQYSQQKYPQQQMQLQRMSASLDYRWRQYNLLQPSIRHFKSLLVLNILFLY